MGIVLTCQGDQTGHVITCGNCHASFMPRESIADNYCKPCDLHICDTCKELHVCLLPDVKVIGPKKIPVSVKIDEGDMLRITTAKFMPCGELVISDPWNGRIKVLDRSLALQTVIDFAGACTMFDVVDDKNILAKIDLTNELRFIQVLPAAALGRSIFLDVLHFTFNVVGDNIYVVCNQELETRALRIYDMNGKMKTQYPVELEGDTFAVNKSGDKIFDYCKESFRCLSLNNEILFRHDFSGLNTRFFALCVDDEDNVFVCDCLKIIVISSSGKQQRILKKYSDKEPHCLGCFFPSAIAFRSIDKTLVIGSCYARHLLLFKLQ